MECSIHNAILRRKLQVTLQSPCERRSGFYTANWILILKPCKKEIIGKPGHKWEGNIKTNLILTVCKIVDSMPLAQYGFRCWNFLNRVMNVRAP